MLAHSAIVTEISAQQKRRRGRAYLPEERHPTVDIVDPSGAGCGLVGAEVDSKRGDLLGLHHSANRSGLGELVEHFLFVARIILAQIIIHERSMNARRANAIAPDIVTHVVGRY